jgi:hypothetical protein
VLFGHTGQPHQHSSSMPVQVPPCRENNGGREAPGSRSLARSTPVCPVACNSYRVPFANLPGNFEPLSSRRITRARRAPGALDCRQHAGLPAGNAARARRRADTGRVARACIRAAPHGSARDSTLCARSAVFRNSSIFNCGAQGFWHSSAGAGSHKELGHDGDDSKVSESTRRLAVMAHAETPPPNVGQLQAQRLGARHSTSRRLRRSAPRR